MNSCRTLCVVSLVLLVFLAGCGGGGGGFNPNNVTVTVSPATVTVPEGGQVTLKATVNGLCSTCSPVLAWFIIDKNTGLGGAAACVWLSTPPVGPCPDGTIQLSGSISEATVTYSAPSTSGMFVVDARDYTGFSSYEDGTAGITVP